MNLFNSKISICVSITVLLLSTRQSIAQKASLIADTLTPMEQMQMEAATRNSFQGYCYLSDSFSKRGDTTMASVWLLRVTSYYFLFEHQTPETINDFLSARFKLTRAAKEKCIQSFDSLYNAPKSEAFNKFKQMFDEDQQVRNVMDKAADSLTYAKEALRMRHTDSVHFDYLYNYVLKKGWPSIEDGGLFANLIAIHDHEHYDLYIPAMKKAVLDGNAFLSALGLILYWKHSELSYEDLKKRIGSPRKRVFDVSSMLDDQLPSCLERIEKAVRKHCPVRVVLVYESKVDEDYVGWTNKMEAMYHRNKQSAIITQLFNDLLQDCHQSFVKDLWSVWYLPSERTKMMFYVLY